MTSPLSITLAAQPASVSASRRFVRGVVEAVAAITSLIDDAVLVTSELVANAVLHAGGPITVEVTVDEGPPARIRVDVHDDSPVVPAVRHYGPGASTGRGLALVSRLADRWGVEPSSSTGKAVWVELVVADAPSDAVALQETVMQSPPPPAGTGAVPTRYLEVPVHLYLRLQEQNDAVLRELELLAFAADHDGDLDPSPDLVEVTERARRFFNLAREGFRREVLQAAAKGRTSIDLEGLSDPSALVPSAEFVALFERAEELAARGELLVGPAPEGVGRLRRWFVAEMSRQLVEGRPPAPFVSEG